jgi:hypothetical protein
MLASTTSSSMPPLPYFNPISTLSELPNELLTEIFILSTPIPIKIPWSLVDDRPPLSLFLVCSRWRSILLGMPGLWENIWVQYGYYESMRRMEDMSRISHKILSRSANHSLSLKIDCPILNTDNLETLPSLITNNTRRLVRLELDLSGKVLRELLSLQHMHFDNLQYLSIFWHDEIPQSLPFTLFRHSPLLRVVELKAAVPWLIMKPEIPWAGLTTLSLARDSGGVLSASLTHSILRQCSSLNHFHITLSSESSLVVDTITVIHCPLLRTLLVEVHCDEAAIFLRPLDLPGLLRLELICSSNPPNLDHPVALSAISRFTQLRSLKIDLYISSAYDMTEFLESLPNLVSLTLPPDLTLSQSTFSLLSSGELLPELQTLHAIIASNTLRAYLQMLNTRADRGHKTRGLLIWSAANHPMHFSDDDNYIAEKLTKQGLLQFVPLKRDYPQPSDIVLPGIVSWT